MRQIKFRGKTESGHWVYGTPVYYQSGEVCIFNDNFDHYGCEATNIAAARDKVDPATIGQAAGLKDSKGKDVFEGDIVRHSLGFSSYEFSPPYHPTGHDGYGTIDCIGTIMFKEGSFVLRCDKVLKETSPWHDEYNLTRHFLNKFFGIKGCESIGNIHDNPELLQS